MRARTTFAPPARLVAPLTALTAALLAALLAAGCVVTTGQFLATFDLADPLLVTSPLAIARTPVDLNAIDAYNDRKGDLHDLADLALLGDFTNTGNTPVEMEFWMTTGPSTHATAADVRGDPTALRVWGPLALAPNETRHVSWDEFCSGAAAGLTVA